MTGKLSSVHRGAAFEQRSLRLLQAHFSMSLRRVGGRSDGGVDLVGWWWLPFAVESNSTHPPGALPDADGLLRRRLRVIAQCKAEKKKFSPKYVREMEGVWHLQSPPRPAVFPLPLLAAQSESVSQGTYPTVALLLSESPFSRSTVLRVYQSLVPFLLVHLPSPISSAESDPISTSEDVPDMEIATVCPNPALTHLVQPLAFCWERNPSAGLSFETDASLRGRPGLWWHGRKISSWAPELPERTLT